MRSACTVKPPVNQRGNDVRLRPPRLEQGLSDFLVSLIDLPCHSRGLLAAG